MSEKKFQLNVHERIPVRIVNKAKTVIRLLNKGISFHQLHGKRFVWDRNKISFPIGGRYRLLCFIKSSDDLIRARLMSHEKYNRVCKP